MTKACEKIGNGGLQKAWQRLDYQFDNGRVTHGDYTDTYCLFFFVLFLWNTSSNEGSYMLCNFRLPRRCN